MVILAVGLIVLLLCAIGLARLLWFAFLIGVAMFQMIQREVRR